MARVLLHRRQAEWAHGFRIGASQDVLEAALERAGAREAAAVRDGEYIREGVFKYDAAREEARWALTREILCRVSPGHFEDPTYIEMLARQAASVEYVLASKGGNDGGVSHGVLSRILIGTTPEPRSEAYSELISDIVIIAISAGMMDFMYRTSKAVVLAWKMVTPPKGSAVSFSGLPEDTEEVLQRDPYPSNLFHDTLATWLYEGRPRAIHSRILPNPCQWPLGLLINGAERFVVAHEYAHALLDQLAMTTSDTRAPDASPAPTPWARELRADAFAFLAVSESSHELDLLPRNMALQGAILAMKAHQIFDRSLDIARRGVTGTDIGSATHPPFELRIAQLEQAYVQGHPDEVKARADLRGMLVPSQTIEQLWQRVFPRLIAQYRAGRPLHSIWSTAGG
jgi:hypothetical protein